jgi:hypothetical protein
MTVRQLATIFGIVGCPDGWVYALRIARAAKMKRLVAFVVVNPLAMSCVVDNGDYDEAENNTADAVFDCCGLSIGCRGSKLSAYGKL